MEEQVAQGIYRKAVNYARRIGFSEHAEDLAQDVLLKYTQGKGQHQTVEFAIIDAIRSRFDDRRRKSEKPKEQAFISEPVSPAHSVEEDVGFAYLLDKMDREDRIMACLKYMFDFTEKEIGLCFGISEGRVCQKLKVAYGKMRKRVRAS